MFPWYLQFLKEMSSLFYCFPLFLCIVHLRSPSYLSLLFWNSAFSRVYLFRSPLLFALLLFSAICKASSDNHFVFLHFFFFGLVLVTASYMMLWTSIHSSSDTLECFKSHQRNEGNFRFIFGIFPSTHRIEMQKIQGQNLSGSKMHASLFRLSLVEKWGGEGRGKQVDKVRNPKVF